MPRDLPIGNGSVLVAFGNDSLLREFYFPHVGEENHTKGDPFRFGVWVNGVFSWVPEGWDVQKNYLEDTLVTQVDLYGFDLHISCNDLIDFEENLYLKKVMVENLSDEEKEVRLFLGQDLSIYGNEIGDTAAFRPENNALLHYKSERYFLINVRANNKFGIDFFATGNKNEGGGTWKDAEDGVLSGNPIAQGAVDSVIGVPMTLSPREKGTFYYWIAIGKHWEEVKAIDALVKKKTPELMFQRTHDYWKSWVTQKEVDFLGLPEKIVRQYKRSLLICRTQINNCGSIIAANDSDTIHFNRDTYSYMWPRDGSLVAYGLDLAGYEITEKFYDFCTEIISKEGFLYHKYTPSGALASSWHPWVSEKKAQLPIQEDETALVIWALWKHYERYRDLEFIRCRYDRLIKRAADFMMNYRDLKTGLPLPSYDLWEERQGVLTFTVSAVYGGLMAAANFAECFGESGLAKEYRDGAKKMREAMDKHLYLKEEKRFARMINFKKDGSIEVDATIDASVYAIFAFGAYSPDDEKVQSTMNQVIEKLWDQTGCGGLIRYENDPFYREGEGAPSNPWFVTTLWLAQYYIASAKTNEELDRALNIFHWVVDHALPSGVLAEQINPGTQQPMSVSPLTWSHGTFIATVQEYLKKRTIVGL